MLRVLFAIMGHYGDLIYAVEGENTITFNYLPDGVYSNLSIDISDAAGNKSEILEIPHFTVDTSNPVIEHVSFTTSPADKTHIKDGDSITAKIEYHDNLSGLDQEECKLTFKLKDHDHSHVVFGGIILHFIMRME